MSSQKKLQKFIFANILAMIGISCYVLADTFFISIANGSDGIAALNLTLPIYSLLFAIGSMIGIGSATYYTIYKVSNNPEGGLFFSNAILSTIIISLIFIIIGLFFPIQVMELMGADESLATLGKGYIRIVLLCSPFFMLNYSFSAFIRNDNAPTLAMTATLASSLSNIFLDWFFMFPMKLGINGAALATGISPIISMCICSLHFLSKQNGVKFILHLPSFKRTLKACKLGIAAFVGEISSGVTTTVFNLILINIAGNTGVAAYAVIANTALVGIAVFNGVSQGAQPIASEAYGQNNNSLKRYTLKTALTVAGILATVLFALILLLYKPCVSLFNAEHSTALSSLAEVGIRLYFIGFLFAGINIISTGYLSAVEKAGYSFTIAITRGLIAIVFYAFILSKLFGIVGVWLAFPASEFTTMLITIALLKKSMPKDYTSL